MLTRTEVQAEIGAARGEGAGVARVGEEEAQEGAPRAGRGRPEDVMLNLLFCVFLCVGL